MGLLALENLVPNNFYLCKPKNVQVRVFVEETLRKGVSGLIEEFRSMKRTNDFTKMTEFLANNIHGRNRYKVRTSAILTKLHS